MEYPERHKRIVEDLMTGKFILSNQPHFDSLKEQEGFYTEFFFKSFGYDLFVMQEYAYLVSDETDETMSRDFSIFFALLCFELDKQGKNFMDDLRYSEFSFEDVNLLFENSSYIDLIRSNKQLQNTEARRRLLGSMAKRNIVEKINEDKFQFTPAYQVFIDFAKEFGQQKTERLKEA